MSHKPGQFKTPHSVKGKGGTFPTARIAVALRTEARNVTVFSILELQNMEKFH